MQFGTRGRPSVAAGASRPLDSLREPRSRPWGGPKCNNLFSTIETEKNNNPRLQVTSKEEYAEIMQNLNLANPKMMDIAVPANVKGLTLDQM